MSSPYDPLAGIDIQEQLRRRQLLQGMFGAPQDQQDTTVSYSQPTDQSIQVPQFNPQQFQEQLVGIQKNLPFQNIQPPTQEVQDLSQAGTKLGQVASQAVTPGATDPQTGKPLYPRSKALTALVAPLMLRQILRDPQKGIEGLNVLTRKGYGAAEQEHARSYQEARTQYEAARDIAKDKLEVFSKEVTGNDQWAKLQMDALKEGIKGPLDIANEMARLRETQARTKEIEAGRMRSVEMGLFTDGINEIEKQQGTPATQEQRLGVYRKIEEAKGEFTANQAMNRLLLSIDSREHEAELNRQQREQLDTDKKDFNKWKEDYRSFDKDLAGSLKTVNSELDSMSQARNNVFAAITDKNSAAQFLAGVQLITTMGDPGHPISRFNSKEYDRIVGAFGVPQEIYAKIKNLIGKGSAVPPELMDAAKRLYNMQISELQLRQDMIVRAQNRNNDTQDSKGVNSARTDYYNERNALLKGESVAPTTSTTPLNTPDALDLIHKRQEELRKK